MKSSLEALTPSSITPAPHHLVCVWVGGRWVGVYLCRLLLCCRGGEMRVVPHHSQDQHQPGEAHWRHTTLKCRHRGGEITRLLPLSPSRPPPPPPHPSAQYPREHSEVHCTLREVQKLVTKLQDRLPRVVGASSHTPHMAVTCLSHDCHVCHMNVTSSHMACCILKEDNTYVSLPLQRWRSQGRRQPARG